MRRPIRRERIVREEPVDLTQDLEWPSEFKHAFAISMHIRPDRARRLRTRLGRWSPFVRIWTATNGYAVSRQEWEDQGLITSECSLSRGELGCYDSHVRLWKHMIERKLPMALILEDDANIRYTQEHAQRLKLFLQEIREKAPDWEMLYLGTGERSLAPVSVHGGTHFALFTGCRGLFAYALTLEGARKLVAKAKPYTVPVDVMVGRLVTSRHIKCYGMNPSLCYVVPVSSDTVGIK